MLTLPIMTADAVTTDGQAIIKELKQFGGVSSQVISEAAKKGTVRHIVPLSQETQLPFLRFHQSTK